VIYELLRILVNLFFRLFNRVEVLHPERIPKAGPVVLASNHRSNWDPVFIGAMVRRPVHYLAKAELFKHSFFAFFLTRLHAVSIKRGTMDRNALVKVSSLLNAGQIVLIFPEGKRSLSGELGEFRPGAAMFAAKTGASLVPVAVRETHRLFPSGFRRKVTLSVGEPVAFPEQPEKQTALERQNQINTLLRDRILSLLDGGEAP
jgi:1-acyl-sn-glycerol-3-phosphate acyltransferase